MYPVPALVTLIPVTIPPAMTDDAIAPVPLPPVIYTGGAEGYPVPPVATAIVAIPFPDISVTTPALFITHALVPSQINK